MNEIPLDGNWYWVSKDAEHWWPAKRDAKSCGGWTIEDTWEDFDGEVKFWLHIEPPENKP